MTYSYPTDDKHNRIRGVVDNLIGTEDPDDLMMELMEAVGNTVTPVPDVGKYYAFVYSPKTPNIEYDAHPLVPSSNHQDLLFLLNYLQHHEFDYVYLLWGNCMSFSYT